MYTEETSYDGKVNLIDVTSEQFRQNPYRFYKERREAGNLIEVRKGNFSTMSYDWGNQILANRDVGRMPMGTLMDPEAKKMYDANPVVKIIQNWMLLKNPPSHTRLRKLISNAFTPKMVADLEETMRELIRERLDAIESRDEFNFISEIAYPFPVGVISEMMGLPKEDIPQFRKWSQDFAMALAVDVTTLPDKQRMSLNQSARDLTKYFEELLKTKKGQMEEGKIIDLLSTLLAAKDEDALTTEELLSNATLLLVAGHETTTNLLGNGLRTLLMHPDQMQQLKGDQSLIPNAVEEFLRYDAPVQSVGRFVLEDTEINGRQFHKGEHFSVAIGGCNRDPSVNPDPDTLDITRDEINHLSFAKGIHYCLGAPLARLEGKVAFEEILDRFPDITLKQEPVLSNNWLLRGYSELIVEP